MKFYDEFLQFLVQMFLFIKKSQLETMLQFQLSKNNYFLTMIGIWLVVIVLIWFVLYVTYKIIGYFH